MLLEVVGYLVFLRVVAEVAASPLQPQAGVAVAEGLVLLAEGVMNRQVEAAKTLPLEAVEVYR